MIGLKRVLVPTDFSETSDAALKYGVELAGAFGAVLHVLHVVNKPMHEAWAGYAPGTSFLLVVEHMETEARRRIEERVSKEDVATGRTVPATVWGDASDQILEYAIAHHIDLIVCGTHGRNGWDHFMMGSVAEKIVRKAPCPVLTVRHPEHEFVLPADGEPERTLPAA
jgi:nucleotide-binding universal stress UspA family protein